MRKVGSKYKQKASKNNYFVLLHFGIVKKRCEMKQKHAKNIVIFYAKRSENYAKQFAFNFYLRIH
jgi:hypothetical protein